MRRHAAAGMLYLLSACAPADSLAGPPRDDAPAEPPLRQIPVVVHVLHAGEPEGDGTNLSGERIHAQIRILNEDFQRRPGTPGFNTDPTGGDARLEFRLAERAPDGTATSGVVRVDVTGRANPHPANDVFRYSAHYGYWPRNEYVNIWVIPLPDAATDVVLGFATGPQTDLPGADFLAPGEPTQPEGIVVNAAHFGPDPSVTHGQGRTLTHEMGHYLGLLHPWGGGDCAANDFVHDTPAVAASITSCVQRTGCSGEPTQPSNYMTFAPDACMNVFTRGQIARMHHVLDSSPGRSDLAISPGLIRE